jgi:hypothetical protein
MQPQQQSAAVVAVLETGVDAEVVTGWTSLLSFHIKS